MKITRTVETLLVSDADLLAALGRDDDHGTLLHVVAIIKGRNRVGGVLAAYGKRRAALAIAQLQFFIDNVSD